MTLLILQTGAGLILLIGGAELLVRGSSRLARRFGIPSLIIGLTIVAIGTSSPELAVSVQAALTHHPEMAYSNVIGSNIFNILFILGLSALVFPLSVSVDLIRKDIPIMIGISLLFGVFLLNLRLEMVEAAVMLALLLVYFSVLIFRTRAFQSTDTEEKKLRGRITPGVVVMDAVLISSGLILLILGSRWLINGGGSLAVQFGVSERIIGLTLLAMGTSLPEAASSLVASLRKETDIAIGNVVGSNIFNILAVAGTAGLLQRTAAPVPQSMLTIDTAVMLFASLLLLPLAFTGKKLDRREGVFLLLIFAGYITFLIAA